MSLPPLWIVWLQCAGNTLDLAISWFLHSALVIALGLGTAHLLRHRGSALQSAIYRTTLLVAMASPLAAVVLHAWGVSLVSLPGMQPLASAEWESFEVEHPAEDEPSEPALPAPRPRDEARSIAEHNALHLPPAAGNGDAIASDDAFGRQTLFEMAENDAPRDAQPGAEVVLSDELAAIETAEAAALGAPVYATRLVWRVSRTTTALALLAALAWVVASLALLSRLVVEFLRVAALRRGAHAVTGREQWLCAELARRVGVRSPELLQTPFVASPCLVGIRRPAILLPEELGDDALDVALVHELAHLRRGDCLWNLLRQISCAVLCFQPLIWRLSKHIERTAEEVCDDYAVQFGADRASYADLLVRLAEQSWLPASYAAVPLVTLRSAMGRRVARILDRSRQLNLSISLATLCAVVAAGLVTTLAAGLFNPGPRASVAAAADEQQPTLPQSVADVPQEEDAESEPALPTLEYRGQVVAPDGKPVEGAKLYLVFWSRSQRPNSDLPPLAITDAEGQFRFTLDPTPLARDSRYWLHGTLVAAAPGYGLAFAQALDFETTGRGLELVQPERRQAVISRIESQGEQRLLTLVADDVPLRGQLITTEGAPIPGARVRVKSIFTDKSGSLDEWEAATRNSLADFYSVREKAWHGFNGKQIPSFVRDAVSDDEGRFTIAGIGRERIVELLVNGQFIETTQLTARTRLGDVVRLPSYREAGREQAREAVYWPAEFSCVIGPSVPVTGQVVDADSGQPLAGVLVQGGQQGTFFGFGKPEANATTDADGRYELHGLPLDEEAVVFAFPSHDDLYLAAGARMTLAAGRAANQDFRLKRGVLVRGRAVDSRTGLPLSGRVDYNAFESNPQLRDYPGFARAGISHERRAGEDGRFEIVVLPGPGILTFMADDHQRFRRGVGAENIRDPAKQMAGSDQLLQLFSTVPRNVVSVNEHVLLQIDPQPGAEPLLIDFEYPSGLEVQCLVVDPDDRPIAECYIAGTSFADTWYKFPGVPGQDQGDGVFHVDGYYADEPRDLYFFEPERNLAGHYRLAGDPPADLKVQLEPAGSMTGRLIDEYGAPVENARIQGPGIPSNSFAKPDLVSFTDGDGRFTIRGLIPGRKYTVSSYDGQRSGIVVADATVTAGETLDLGNVHPSDPPPRDSIEDPADKLSTADSAEATEQPHIISGRVVGPDGEGVAGAGVLLIVQSPASLSESNSLQATADGQGRFRLEHKTPDDAEINQSGDWRDFSSLVIAAATGYGAVWVEYHHIAGNELIVRLSPSEPLRGRVIDPEGQPISGVTVRTESIGTNGTDDLTAWIAQLRKSASWQAALVLQGAPSRRLSAEEALVDAEAVSDQAGNFVLNGAGRGRVIELRLSGAGIVNQSIRVATLDIEPVVVAGRERGSTAPSLLGNHFEYVAEPSQSIEGRVFDADTGEPLPGVRVRNGIWANYHVHQTEDAISDAQGRYRLEGIAKNGDKRIVAIPADDQPYLMRKFDDVAAAPAFEPIQLDLPLHRGVLITGRLTNKHTQQPVRASLAYLPWPDNPHGLELPEFSSGSLPGPDDRYHTDDEGKFRLVGLPGRGLVAVIRIWDDQPFALGQGLEQIPDLPSEDAFRRISQLYPLHRLTAVKEVRIDDDQTELVIDIEIESGRSLQLRLVDENSQPIHDVQVVGGLPANQSRNVRRGSGPTIDIQGLHTNESRVLLLSQSERQLGKSLIVPSDIEEQQPLDVTLEAFATVTGRLVDALGTPLVDAEVSFRTVPGMRALRNVRTDSEGRFSHPEVLSGLPYSVSAHLDNFVFVSLAEDFQVEPGETIDLGEIDVTQPRRPEPLRTRQPANNKVSEDEQAANAVSSEPPNNLVADKVADDDPLVISGRVVGPDGKPVPEAWVSVIGDQNYLHQFRRGGDFSQDSSIVAQGQCNPNGRFALHVANFDSKAYRQLNVVARQQNHIGWQQLDPTATPHQLAIQLLPDEPLRGQLLNTEGQPAAGVRLSVTTLQPRNNYMSREGFIRYKAADDLAAAWVPSVVTDEQGRFTLRGIPATCGAWLLADGSDQFAPQVITVNTGLAEQRGQRDATYRPVVKNVELGQSLDVVLSPAKRFEGLVTYGSSNRPVPNARVVVWASQQELGGSWSGGTGVTDSEGNYRISAEPGLRYRIEVHAPDGVPYLSWKTPNNDVISWETGETVKRVDIALRRGVLIEGTVTEMGTGTPVPLAAVQYVPTENTRRVPDDVLIGWSDIRLTDDQGNFAFAVPSGVGRVLVHGPNGAYVAQAVPSQELYSEKPGGGRRYAHAIERIDVQSRPSSKLNIQLKRAATVSGTLVDEQGQPIDKALVITRLHIYPTMHEWSPTERYATQGRFELTGLEDGEEYSVHFLDQQRRMGATALLTAGDEQPVVVLRPCAELTARLIDSEGNPRADYIPALAMVVTPGVSPNDYKSQQAGQLAADSEWVVNIDRVNQHLQPQTDADGRITVPALIPGATYRFEYINNGSAMVSDEYTMKAGERLDVGDVVIDERD